MPKELHRAPDSLSVWRSNIRELKSRQPQLAAALETYVEQNGHAFEHYENATPAGKWVEGLADEPFFERNGEPNFNWSRKKREDRNKPVFILYGVGTPPYLFKAIRALPEAALAMIVAEPNIGLLAYTLHMTHVYEAAPEQCRLVFLIEGSSVGNTEKEKRDSVFLNTQILREECLGASLRPIGFFAAALSMLSAHDGELDIWRDRFSRMLEGIREWVTVTLAYLGNSAEDTLLGFRQIALMSPQIAFGPRLEPLFKKFAGRPAVCVAAGPSLDKNFTLLRDIQDKCLIMVADAVLGKLLRNGIKPHIVTSLERVIDTYRLFFSGIVEEFHDECRDILLVAQSLCVPWTSGRWPGPCCLVYKEEVVLDAWFAGGVLGGSGLTSGISVAHMNYSLAHYMGASSIAIIGQDLAFGEDGSSHSGNVAGGGKADRTGAIEIPGALGGMVKTTSTWISFLRFLETLVFSSGIPTSDCTEGGALIAGTTIEPFAKFIEEKIIEQSPLDATPADVIKAGAGETKLSEIKTRVLASLQKQYTSLDIISKGLDEVERLMKSTAAPGLDQARRREYAARTGAKIDNIHASSPVFDFIGQSYTRLATMELALTRSLDDVETVERWYLMHKEVVDSHRAAVSFVRRWISYAERAVAYWGDGRLEFGPLTPDDAWDRAVRLFTELEEADDDRAVEIRLEIDNVMMRCDPIRLKWPGRVLWAYAALLLKNEGRAALATTFMDAAAADFEGKEMPVDDMAAFFKDYARVLMGHDLTHQPNPFKAEQMLSNAVDVAGGADDEAREILSELLGTEVSYQSIIDEATMFKKGEKISAWFADRAVAQRQLFEGDIKRALMSVWNAIDKHWRVVPGWAASHLAWLVKTMDKCLDADDRLLLETIAKIADGIASSTDLIGGVPVKYPRRIVELLVKHGLRANMTPVDPEEKPAEVGVDA
ncbi:MAG: DUF115 domain-containing protein [Synergistaceae bacterium]|jgi:hypothetical protein|nr:DUF115 domain-containing protein [Synergistaceae bacterium]